MANIQKFDDLYARNSQGGIKTWRVEVEDGEIVLVRSFAGLLNGKKTPQINKVKEGKNKGKANETTPFQQGISDAQSKWNKRKREGYKSLRDLGLLENLEGQLLEDALDDALPEVNSDASGNIIPMKAQQFYKDKDRTIPRIKFPCYGQPKINGVRAVAEFTPRGLEFRSKKGLVYKLMTHIANQFLPSMFFSHVDSGTEVHIIFDGELYIPNTKLQEIGSAVDTLSLMTQTVQFHIFDLAIPNFSQRERNEIRDKLLNIDHNMPHIINVETRLINNLEEALAFHQECKEKGYEGSIFRSPLTKYEFGKRPATMVKLKDKESLEFIIVDVIESQNDPGLAIMRCRNDINNETFDVVPEGGDELRRKYLLDRRNLIGKLYTVEFYERTSPPKELPFHTTGVAVRDYE